MREPAVAGGCRTPERKQVVPMHRRHRQNLVLTSVAAALSAVVLMSTLAVASQAQSATTGPTDAAAMQRMRPGSVMVMPRTGNEAMPSEAQATTLASSLTGVQPAATTNATDHHVTLELVATDGVKPDFTLKQAQAGIAQLKAFYRRETNGAINIVLDRSYNWVTDPVNCSDWYDTFANAKARVNWAPGPDKHLIIMLPNAVDCGYGGLGGEGATVDSGESLITVGPILGYTAHEFGHNVSLVHQGTLTCDGTSDGTYLNGAWSNGCRTTEYGDAYDVMGAPWYNFDLDAASLYRLGALPTYTTVPPKSRVSVRIAPISGNYNHRRAATFVDAAGIRYWIEARSVNGNTVFDPHPAADDPDFPNGVRIIRDDPSEPGHNVTLQRPGDTSPTAQLFRTGDVARLADGTTVTVTSVTANVAVVLIRTV